VIVATIRYHFFALHLEAAWGHLWGILMRTGKTGNFNKTFTRISLNYSV
jgi:hypothetical protein